MLKKIIYFVLFVLLVLAGLVTYGAYNANSLIAKYKPKLEEYASNAVGQPVKLGEMSVKAFPGLNAKIASLDILNFELEDKSAFSLKNLYLSLKILPLILKKQLAIKKISISKPDIKISNTSSGIQIKGLKLGAKSKKTTTEKFKENKSKTSPKTLKPNKKELGISLDSIEVNDGSLVYSDLKAGTKFDLSEILLTSGINFLNKNLELKSTSLNAMLNKQIDLSATLRSGKFSLNENKIRLNGVVLKTLGNVLNSNISGNTKNKSFSGDINGNVALDSLSPLLKIFTKNKNSLKISGQVTPDIKFNYLKNQIPNFNGNVLVKNVSTKLSKYSLSNLSGNLNLESKKANHKISSNKIDFNLNGSSANLNFNGLFAKDKVSIDKYVLQMFGGETNGDLTYNVKKAKLENLNAKSKNIDIKKVVSTLQIPIQYNLDDLTSVSMTTTVTGDKAVISDLSLGTFGGHTNADIVFDIGKGVLQKLDAESKNIDVNKVVNAFKIPLPIKLNDVTPVSLKTSVNRDIATLKELSLGIFGGSLKGQIEYDLSKAYLNKFITDLADIDIAKALLALNSQLELTGSLKKANTNVSGAVQGIPNSLAGNLSVNMIDGMLKKVNIAAQVLQKIGNIPKVQQKLLKAVPEDERKELEIDGTVIKKLTGDFSLKSGKLSTNNLKLLSTYFDLSGKGVIGLDGSFDVSGDLLFSTSFSAFIAKSAKEVRSILDSEGRLSVPLQIVGKAPKILVLPDLEKLLKIGAKAVLKEKGEELIKDKLKDKLGEAGGEIVNDLLGGLFGS